MKQSTYPEIEAMTKTELRHALNIAYTNGGDGAFLKEEARPDFLARLAAMETRYKQLGGRLA